MIKFEMDFYMWNFNSNVENQLTMYYNNILINSKNVKRGI